MQVELRLLGRMQLFVEGADVTPGAAKRRAVLTALALGANRPVSLNRLSKVAWGDVPPPSAVANLRSHAMGLRRVLGDRLLARSNAYELCLAGEELDVDRFQRLASKGRADLAAGKHRAAVATLTAALDLWRGPAGDGLPPGPLLDGHWASLEEQRLQVFEEWAQARLAVGDHGDLLGDLRRHLAAHPLRERAWGQLMLALYLCGDVPACLTAYREARAALDEHLGVEPGEELAALHRAVLDRSLETTHTAGTSAGPESEGRGNTPLVPRELPANLTTFVGRTQELADVVAAVRGRTPAAVVVSGPAGSGKTALAVRAAHAVATEFPDGQVFVDLGRRPSMTAGEVLGRVLRALGVPAAEVPGDVDERAGWYRSRVAGRRMLLVVDGVTGAEQVRPLIPAGPGPALIVVGQRRLHGLDGVTPVGLRPLSATGAWALLAAHVGADRLDAEPAATAGLIRLCAGSVLALRITALRLASHPKLAIGVLIGQARDAQARLDLLAFGDQSVRASLAAGVAAVRSGDEVAGRILALLGETPDAAAAPDRTAARLGVSAERVWRALEDLVDAHLVSRDERAGYRLPALVDDYVAELAATPLTAGGRMSPMAA
ncbi:DNA-binding transcriptional activator of the SARP family [Micromonospora purpureochromogenes]|uniref:DNA-binding transcriptional activator of the SARP family n=1 Tax=Micromonospora purpureochromogenes TaxID=47872 RepID=A0A1C4XIQ5_9ACTN|nr:AfsR/SARP family transcriptional regulator [Micromonospora purpureochromogenes]SCF08409.1 DNA-binding transcriptional activator of the SARP family [Micromonospora purpureochromogenes]